MKKTLTLMILFAFAAITFFVSYSEARMWTSRTGQQFDGEFVKLEGDTVHITLPDGDAHHFKLELLSNEDKAFISAQSSGKNIAEITEANKVIAVSTYDSHCLFIKADGSLYGMGYNYYGQLLDGGKDADRRKVPALIAKNVIAASAGNYHSLFIKKDGTLWGLGDTRNGALGTATNGHHPVLLASDVAHVCAGRKQTYFIKKDGTLWAMGLNDRNQLGVIGEKITTPVRIDSNVAAIFSDKPDSLYRSGYYNYLKKDGSLWKPEKPSKKSNGKPKPMLILPPGKTISAALGYDHSLYLGTNNTLYGIGANAMGQLGIGTKTEKEKSIVTIASDVVSVAAGGFHSLFITRDGTLYGMGSNNGGRLGDGTTTVRTSPVKIASDVTSVSAGFSTYFIKKDGTLWATGSNTYGMLGTGDMNDRNTPERVQVPFTDGAAE
jgi:alpha-tubulin suppressor-like RCC1 family protein